MSQLEFGTSEAARRLGVSPQRVRALIQAGRIRARLVGSRFYVIREADLARFEASRRRQGGRPRKEESA